jgi:hypothetical protein
VTADTLDFGACLFRCVLMGQLREHSFELKGYLLRTNIIPHFVLYRERSGATYVFCLSALTRLAGLHPLRISLYARAAGSRDT